MGYICGKWFLYYYSGLSQVYYSGLGFFITILGLECGLRLQLTNQELIKLASPYLFPTFTFTFTFTTTTITTTTITITITTMSSTPTSLALAVVIYTTDDTATTTAAVGARSEDEVEEEDEDEFDDAIGKSILLGRF